MSSMGSANAATPNVTHKIVSAYFATVAGTAMGTAKSNSLIGGSTTPAIPTSGITWPRTR